MRRVLLAVVGLMVSAGACSTSQHVRQQPGETLAALPALPTTIGTTTMTTVAPPTTVVLTYVVRPGDSFLVIAGRLHVDPDALAVANGIGDRNLLIAGQVLVVPPPTTADATSSTTTG